MCIRVGGFVRVVDAVKGPFHPSDPPTPTFIPDAATPPPAEIFCPLPDADSGKGVEPLDPY